MGIDDAITVIQEFEGLELTAYPDPGTGGAPYTIGWGCTHGLDGRPIRPGQTITRAEALELLRQEVSALEARLGRTVPYWTEMQGPQQVALLSFAFNVGGGFYGAPGFETISRVLRDRRWDEVPAALLLYRNPGTNVEEGLRRRREAEGDLWRKAIGPRQAGGPELLLEAQCDTWLKKLAVQASTLPANQKVAVPAGQKYRAIHWRESPADRGHVQVELSDGAGVWLVWAAHWTPWAAADTGYQAIAVDPSDFEGRVSRFFTWGEVFQWRPERVVRDAQTLERVRALAQRLDGLRQEFGPLQVTSWMRPEPWNRLAGGVRGSRHTLGDAADIYPQRFDPQQFEDWLDRNWDGGVGYGIRSGRGFVHVDLGPRRRWNY